MVKSTEAIYLNIANEFGVGKQSIYLSAKRFLNRGGIIEVDETKDERNDDDNDEFIPIEYFGKDFKCYADDIYMQLNIENVNLFYTSINEINVTSEWSDTFSGILWEFFRLPCAWSFQRIREICNEFVIVGQCRSTGCAKVFAFTQNKKTILKVRLRSFNDEATHVKKAPSKNGK